MKKRHFCFVQPPHNLPEGEEEYRESRPTIFPVGVATLTAILKRAGYEVSVIDCWAFPQKYREVGALVAGLEPDWVGVGALSSQYNYTRQIVQSIRKATRVPIILGGAGPTLTPEVFLRHTQADCAVIGEGEITLLELLENNADPSGIAGVAYSDTEGNIVINPPRPYIEDLDSLPFPDYGALDMRPYLAAAKVRQRRERAHTIITSRGCPYRCRFCSLTFKGARYRSSEHVLGEVDSLRKQFGQADIHFSDELMLLPRQRAAMIAEGLGRRGIKWNCQGRIDLMNRENLTNFWKCGCRTIGYGIESGSDKILKAMDKRITREQIREVLARTLEMGFQIHVQMIFGYPGEDENTLADTRDLLCEFKLPVHFAVLTPLPGSLLYEELRDQGMINDEDEYLGRLEAGYLSYRKVLLNLTGWSDEEYHRRKKALEDEINQVAWQGEYYRANNPLYPRLYIARHGFRQWMTDLAGRGAAKIKRVIGTRTRAQS